QDHVLALARKLLNAKSLLPPDALASAGLDSLTSAELRNRITADFSVELPYAFLLGNCTARDIALEIVASLAHGSACSPPIETAPLPECVASYGQRSMWYVYNTTATSSAYHIARAVRIDSAIDPIAMRRAFQVVAARRPALRTTFAERGDQLIQHIEENAEAPFTEVDISTWTDEEVSNYLTAQSAARFDLMRDLPIRVVLCRRSSHNFVLLVVVHHIAADLWSFGIILRDLASVYRQSNGETTMPQLQAAQLASYAVWQQRRLAGPAGDRLQSFWLEELRGDLPVLHVLSGATRPPASSNEGREYFFTVEPQVTDRVLRFCRENQV